MSATHHYATDDGVLTVYSWSVGSGDSQATLVHLDEARGRVIASTFDDDMEPVDFPRPTRRGAGAIQHSGKFT